MTLVIRLPAIPTDLPRGTLGVSKEVHNKLEPGDVAAFLEYLRNPKRTAEVLYEDDTHVVELVHTPSGQEVWAVRRIDTETAVVVLPIEPAEEDA